MNIKQQLLVTHSKENSNLVVDYIGDKPELIKELMNCFFSNQYRVTQRSAMVVSALFDKNPELMEAYQEKMILNLASPNLHVAVKRNTVRILQFQKIEEQLQAKLFDFCLNFIGDPKEPIAIKAFSMGVLLNICKEHPELKVEVVPIIEDLVLRAESKGVLSRGKNVLRALNKL